MPDRESKKRFVASVGAFFAVSALFGVANAQEQGLAGPSTTACAGQYNMTFDGVAPYERLFSPVPGFEVQARTYTLPSPVPAGTYNLTAVSYDGYSARVASDQPNEVWFVQFLDAEKNVLAASDFTVDLADFVAEAEWIGGIGQVTWAGADAVQVKALHGWLSWSTPNSVSPICFGADPPATVPVAPVVTVETVPVETVPVPVPVTVPVPVVLPPTRTPVADPIVGTSSFTG